MAFKQRSQQVKTEVIHGTRMSPWEADVLIGLLEEQYFGDPQLKPLKDGQVRLTCVAASEGPGMPLERCRKVSVVVSLFEEDDELDVCASDAGRMEQIRRRRICRLCEQAREQGGLLTQEDLAKYLMCSVRTIRRAIEDLEKDGICVPTRGQQQDIGPTVTHRALAVRRWLEGQEPVAIARAIQHSVRSVERYIESFKRVAWLCVKKGFSVFEAALAVGVSVPVARLCRDLCDACDEAGGLAQRMAEIEVVGSAFYLAQDEKKHSPRPSASSNAWRTP
jgi:DNA-binding transcriptional regulator YhcF (GntR family)